MEKDIKTLIIPDVHGRTFWIEPVKETLAETDAHIVFLGDYHDPYMYEFVEDGDYEHRSVKSRVVKKESVARLREIIALAKENPDRITLLLGNHDCGYAISQDVCTVRRDYDNAEELSLIFAENKGLFKLAYEERINGKHFIYSHAGISETYAKEVFGEEANEDNVVELFNKGYMEDNIGVISSLEWYDRHRGWNSFNYASLVWADAREWASMYDGRAPKDSQTPYGYAIMGHSQLEKDAIIKDDLALLDVRTAFYIDSKGEIHKFYE